MSLQVLALRSETLPPATHTNCLLIGDHSGFVAVDPGSPFSDEHVVLREAITARVQAGEQFLGALLTHRHRDHTSGVAALLKDLSCEVWAHPITAEEVRAKVKVTKLVEEGDRVVSMRVLHTPGHAKGHICLWGDELSAHPGDMVVGDMVAGVGSILIAAPDGNMAQYLQSLERMRELRPTRLFPAHGPVIEAADEKLELYLRHRRWREQRLLDAINGGRRTLPDIVARAYDDTAPALWPLAALAARAHLEHLEEQHQIVRTKPDEWSPA